MIPVVGLGAQVWVLRALSGLVGCGAAVGTGLEWEPCGGRAHYGTAWANIGRRKVVVAIAGWPSLSRTLAGSLILLSNEWELGGCMEA